MPLAGFRKYVVELKTCCDDERANEVRYANVKNTKKQRLPAYAGKLKLKSSHKDERTSLDMLKRR
jgi:hypothetical protein